jgi:glycosyltransferase involved in cell wall biosynthesis
MNKKKKILFIGRTLGSGGAQRQLSYFISNLDRQKFDVSLLLFNKMGVGLNELTDDVKLYSLYTESIDQNVKKKSFLTFVRMIKVFFMLLSLQRKEKFDFLYGNLFGPNILVCILKLIFRGRVKVIISVVNNPNKVGTVKRNLIKRLYRNADSVLSCATGLKPILINEYKIPEDKISIVFNAVNSDFILKRSNEEVYHDWFNDNIPVLISVAHLRPQKGYPYLIRSFKSVLEYKKARLLIIGEGVERRMLEKMVDDYQINDYVEFLGVVSNTNKYVAQSTIFVLPSLWEGLATVLLEAAIVRTPLIATDAPFGSSDVVKDNKTGLLVPVKNSELLSEAIIRMLDDSMLTNELVENAYNHIQDNFTDIAITKKLEKIALSL